jgi:hypothetical protein
MKAPVSLVRWAIYGAVAGLALGALFVTMDGAWAYLHRPAVYELLIKLPLIGILFGLVMAFFRNRASH